MDHDLDNGRASKHTKTTIDATTRAELKVELKVEPISELKQELKEELKAEVKAELKEELIAELMAAKMQITSLGRSPKHRKTKSTRSANSTHQLSSP